MREPILIAVCGRKGVGKTFTTVKYIRRYVSVTPRRKVLIFDANNEYSDKTKYPDIRAISLKDIPLYSRNSKIEIRRVSPYFDDGTPMTLNKMAEVLMWIVRNFHNGLLLIEDINKYVSDNMPGDLIGAICTNRHVGVDIILHYQSIGRMTPKVWQNTNSLRMHRNQDSVDRHRNKFDDKYEYLKLAEMLIENQYEKGNSRYYLWADIDNDKIKSGLPEQEIFEAINEYASQNYNYVVMPYINKRHQNSGQKIYTPEEAFTVAKQKIYEKYFL